MPYMLEEDFGFNPALTIDVSAVDVLKLNAEQLAGIVCCKCAKDNGMLMRVWVGKVKLYACYPTCEFRERESCAR